MRFVRAFAWLRWRVFMNGLERSGRRDAVERFTRATEQLGPILTGILLVPTVAGLAGLGLLAGRAIGRDGGFTSPVALAVRVVLVVLFLTATLGPLFFPAARQPRNFVRLLLLPIPRRVLFAVESASTLADPWILMLVPLVVTMPFGLIWSGHAIGAIAAMVAGVLLLLLVIGLAFFVTSAFQLAMRDRRRGEIIAVVAVFIPLVLSMFSMLSPNRRRTDRRSAEPPVRVERWFTRAPATGALHYLPTELYLATVTRPTADPSRSATALLGLLGLGTAVQGLSWAAYQRLLAGPAATRRRTAAGSRAAWLSMPGLGTAASAVAVAELRLITRAPRGRVALITPILVTGFFAVPTLLGRQDGPFQTTAVPPAVLFGLLAAAFALLAVGPIAFNQFAADGPGLTLQILAPIGDRELLTGKAAGLAVAAVVPALVAQLLLVGLFPRTPPGLALLPPVAVVTGCLTLAPVWAVLSAIFGRAVDLNSIGRGGNPHPAANLLGMLATALALIPPIALGALALFWFERPNAAALLALIWAVPAWLAGRGLLRGPVAAIWRARRENLGLVAQGR
jgi:hypothetical protein